MPRDLTKNEDMSSRCNRYSPLGRRSPLEMPTPPFTPPRPVPPVPAAPRRSDEPRRDSHARRYPAAETPMSVFHAQLMEKLHEKIESRELELVSDAETLTADEGSDSNDSWSSRGSPRGRNRWSSSGNRSSSDSPRGRNRWSSSDSGSSSDSPSSREAGSSRDSSGSPDILGARDYEGNIYIYGFPPAPRTPEIFRRLFSNDGPKVVVEMIPQLDDEPMEIVVDEQPLAFPQPAAAAVPVEDEDDDDCSETSSCWQSDEDEEIQRACLKESDKESDEDLDEASSGRVNRPQVESPQYFVHLNQPASLGFALQEPPYWPEPPQMQLAPVVPQEQPAPAREYNVELMDQDEQEPHFEQASTSSLIVHQLPGRPIIQYGAQARHDLVAEHGPVQQRELNYPFSRYAMQPESDNNNYLATGDYLPHPNNRCTHCGSPRQGMLNPYQQVALLHQGYLGQHEGNRLSDFSIERILSSD